MIRTYVVRKARGAAERIGVDGRGNKASLLLHRLRRNGSDFMRIDLCASDDYTTQGALLEAFAHVGAYPDEDFELAVPLPTGLLPFRAGTDVLTVFVDAWSIDLDGPDELISRLLEAMAARE